MAKKKTTKPAKAKPAKAKAPTPRKRAAPKPLKEAPPPPPPPKTVELLDLDRKPIGEVAVATLARVIPISWKGGPARLYDHVATRADGVWQYAPSDRLTG